MYGVFDKVANGKFVKLISVVSVRDIVLFNAERYALKTFAIALEKKKKTPTPNKIIVTSAFVA